MLLPPQSPLPSPPLLLPTHHAAPRLHKSCYVWVDGNRSFFFLRCCCLVIAVVLLYMFVSKAVLSHFIQSNNFSPLRYLGKCTRNTAAVDDDCMCALREGGFSAPLIPYCHARASIFHHICWWRAYAAATAALFLFAAIVAG